MKFKHYIAAISICLAFHSCSTISQFSVTDLLSPSVGAERGIGAYELGVSACFAGCIGDRLVMAGGCNFPEAGKKQYYQDIYVADYSDGALHWQSAGNLPEPVAYGVSIMSGDSLIFIGGNNTEQSMKSVYSVHLNGMNAEVKAMPELPYPIDNMTGAISGKNVYVFGGNQNGKASGKLLKMNLRTGVWQEVSTIPGTPRVQPVCAAVGNIIYIWGGFYSDGAASKVYTDGYAYDTKNNTWTLLPEPRDAEGNTLTLSGGTATTVGNSILCLGGVNKDIFLDAISGRYALVKKEDYLKQQPSWYRFNPNMLLFDTHKGTWKLIPSKSEKFAKAGAALVTSPDSTLLYYIGGELKPSIRTPMIEQIRLKALP